VTTAQTPFDLYRAGDFDGALRSARAALDGNSQDPELHHLVGVLLCRTGQIAEGAAELEKAVALAPHDIGARVMLIRALIDLQRPADAFALARRPAAGPHALALWRIRAEAAEAAKAIPERNEALRHAELEAVTTRLGQDPGRIELLLYRARLLGVLRRWDEAEQIYRSILDREPSNVEAVRELGLLYENSNRLDLLDGLISDADSAAIAPDNIAFLRALVAWRERQPKAALEWLSKVSRDDDPERIGHLEAKLHDTLGDPAAAFRAAEAMNMAMTERAVWRERGAEHRDRLRNLADLITPDWASTWTAAAPGERRPPAFLVGFPRSGTTLLDTYLMGHPAVSVIEEVPFFDAIATKLGPIERLAVLDQDEVDQLRQTYFDAMDRQVPTGFKGLVIDKMPLNLLAAPLIFRLFPDARIIFAQRHPCDSVLSGFMQCFELNSAMACFLDIADAAELYDVALETWTRSCAAFPLNVHRFVYEEMVEDPEAALRRLVAFLGLEWREELLDHRATARGRGAISTPSYDQVTEPIHERSSGRWRRYEEQMRPALPLLLPWARRLGYAD